MVFLRLTVKVYPPECLQNRDDIESSPAKPVSFLLVLDNSEDVTLAGLAGLIQKQWKTLRPNAE